MDTLLNQHFQHVLEEYRIVEEVKSYMNDLLFQLEIDVKESIMYENSLCFGITCRDDLNKQILQLKQENTILEEANARYSKLQLIEAEVSYSSFLLLNRNVINFNNLSNMN